MLRGLHSLVELSMSQSPELHDQILALGLDISNATDGFLVRPLMQSLVCADTGSCQYLVDPMTGSLHLKVSSKKSGADQVMTCQATTLVPCSPVLLPLVSPLKDPHRFKLLKKGFLQW